MKRPKPRTINIWQQGPLLHYTQLPLPELRITHSQTYLHTSGVAGALGYTVRRPQRRLCDSHTSLCVHSHPAIKESKGKERKGKRHIGMINSTTRLRLLRSCAQLAVKPATYYCKFDARLLYQYATHKAVNTELLYLVMS